MTHQQETIFDENQPESTLDLCNYKHMLLSLNIGHKMSHDPKGNEGLFRCVLL